jgi:hypothetical protein
VAGQYSTPSTSHTSGSGGADQSGRVEAAAKVSAWASRVISSSVVETVILGPA